MDVLVLGAMAVVLIAITLWLVVGPTRRTEAVRAEEDTHMTPQGDEFEDQYTSATADLSAGGVATAFTAISDEAADARPAPGPVAGAELATAPTAYQSSGEPWSEPTMAREGTTEPDRDQSPTGDERRRRRALRFAAAALLTLGGAVAGAWLYARWQRQRNKPINRLKRLKRRLIR